MKTTIAMPDKLYRQAKATAALRRCKLNDLIEEGLWLVLKAPQKRRPQRRLAELMAGARGIVASSPD